MAAVVPTTFFSIEQQNGGVCKLSFTRLPKKGEFAVYAVAYTQMLHEARAPFKLVVDLSAFRGLPVLLLTKQSKLMKSTTNLAGKLLTAVDIYVTSALTAKALDWLFKRSPSGKVPVNIFRNNMK